jgi:hypothetical protein
MDAKKGKGKKVKKVIKQEIKFGMSVNLDEEEPDIPLEKKVEAEEDGFRIIQAVHTKQEQ